MAVPFSSFNSSPFGFFRKSPLGARGGVSYGPWFYRDSGASNLYSSEDGITFATTGLTFTPVDMTGDRLWGSSGFMEPPYTSITSYSGIGTALFFNKFISSGSAWLTVDQNNGRIYRSTDGGTTWASISHPNSADGDPFGAVISNLIKCSSGRLIALAAENPAPGVEFAWSIYSDDDGATWAGSGQFTEPVTATVNTRILFQRQDGTVAYVLALSPNSRLYTSADEGLTFSSALTGLPANFGSSGVATISGFMPIRSGSSIVVFSPQNYTQNLMVIRNDGVANGDFTTVTDRGVGFLAPDDYVYSIYASDNKLYKSRVTDLSSWTLVTTSPTTLPVANLKTRLVAIGGE